MTTYLPEPPHRHDQPARIGVLLVNLGTPDAPTATAVRAYLKEFLWDPRVVEIPRLPWWLILNGIILNTRPKHSAEKYASIWTEEGSPLRIHTERQAKLLKGWLDERLQQPVVVDWAMRYGTPSVQEKILAMKAMGVDRLLLLPLYPQYAASSTGSALDAAWATLLRLRNPPEIRCVRSFHDDPGYIEALRRHISAYWQEHGQPEVLVMSFHGVPRFSLDKGDPYHCECQKTGRQLAEALGLTAAQYRLTFQSRFGRAEWLKPYTAPMLEELGRAKTRRVDVVCPGFVADCLETLEEIGMEGKASFLNAGGGEYHYIPALNDAPVWLDALAALAERHITGWLADGWNAEQERQTQNACQLRARSLGASN